MLNSCSPLFLSLLDHPLPFHNSLFSWNPEGLRGC